MAAGHFRGDSPIKFRGDSGLNDGKAGNINANLVGGFYDSGNNIKFSFTTAYTVTLLSWSVIEYHKKYADIGELDHIKNIIQWGSDYLLNVFIPSNTSEGSIIYSQVSSLKPYDNPFYWTVWSRIIYYTYLLPANRLMLGVY